MLLRFDALFSLISEQKIKIFSKTKETHTGPKQDDNSPSETLVCCIEYHIAKMSEELWEIESAIMRNLVSSNSKNKNKNKNPSNETSPISISYAWRPMYIFHENNE
jgi:hypothetical protein